MSGSYSAGPAAANGHHHHHHHHENGTSRQDLESSGTGSGALANGASHSWAKQQHQHQQKGGGGGPGGGLLSPANVRALTYGLMNVVSASGIVFANKYVFQKAGFPFTYALTWIHTVFTLLGMLLCARVRMFEPKALPTGKLLPLAAAYVAYIVLGNLSLNVNSVGFYQVMKIAVAPTVIALELLMFGTLPGPRIMASVCIVCMGITVATVTDSQLIRNIWGLVVGFGATLTTALYQIWAGSKQKELKASSMQLLHAYTPHATLMLGALVPMLEPVGWSSHAKGTLLGYDYTVSHVTALFISSALGLMVSLSTFLFIGATSSLTYNVVGHMKTVIILTGGCVFFGDTMPPKKLLGVCIAMVGIIWYTHLKIMSSSLTSSAGSSAGQQQAPLLPQTGKDALGRPKSHVSNISRPGGQGSGRRQVANATVLNAV